MGIRDQHLFVEDIAAVDPDGDRLTVRWIKGGRSRFRRIVRRKARAMSASLTGIPALCALFVVLWRSGFAGATTPGPSRSCSGATFWSRPCSPFW